MLNSSSHIYYFIKLCSISTLPYEYFIKYRLIKAISKIFSKKRKKKTTYTKFTFQPAIYVYESLHALNQNKKILEIAFQLFFSISRKRKKFANTFAKEFILQRKKKGKKLCWFKKLSGFSNYLHGDVVNIFSFYINEVINESLTMSNIK